MSAYVSAYLLRRGSDALIAGARFCRLAAQLLR
jgi:hypothetical protein